MKFNKNHIYSTLNDLKVIIDNNGPKATVKEATENVFKVKKGYRVLVGNELLGYEIICSEPWYESEKDVLIKTIKRERYAHLAYKELYYDLLKKLSSIGFQEIAKED